eukprot:scaffold8828_cov204-Amphora_coffeaeformis.AAC.31
MSNQDDNSITMMMMMYYEQCLSFHGASVDHQELGRCLAAHRYAQEMVDDMITTTTTTTTATTTTAADSFDYARSVLLVLSSSLVFIMQAGFAMLCAGVVRRENLANTMLKNLLDACGSGVAFYTIGWAIAFGGMDATSSDKTFLGNNDFCLVTTANRNDDNNDNMDIDLAFWLFQYAFSAATATIVAGTLADRCRMIGYLSFTLMLVGWVYPVIVHAVWNHQGIFSAYSVKPLWGVGMVDFAGKEQMAKTVDQIVSQTLLLTQLTRLSCLSYLSFLETMQAQESFSKSLLYTQN